MGVGSLITDLQFVFKGGTALLLLLAEMHRFFIYQLTFRLYYGIMINIKYSIRKDMG